MYVSLIESMSCIKGVYSLPNLTTRCSARGVNSDVLTCTVYLYSVLETREHPVKAWGWNSVHIVNNWLL